MHICFLTNEYPKEGYTHGGIGTYVQTLAKKLIMLGHSVSVLGVYNSNKDEVENDCGVKVYRIKSEKIKFFKVLINHYKVNKKLKTIHKETPINIIESNENGLALIKKIKSIKYVIRMHGGHHFFTLYENRPRELKKVILEKWSFSKADYLVAVSQFVSEITSRELKLKKPVKIIFNPVNTVKFYQVDYAKAKLNSLLFVGTICEKKGIRQLVQAMSIVKKEIPNIKLSIVGRDWYFPDKTSFIEKLKKEISPEIKDNIYFLGVKANNEIPKLIEDAELCVYPSHMEAMPLSWLEVLSMGKPFIGSEIGPGFEAVKDGQTGVLCNPHNPKDIAKKIVLQLKNKNRAIEMGKKARQDIISRFDINTVVEQNVAFYNSVL